MAIKTIRVFAEYTSDGYVPMPSQGNIDYGVTVGSTFPETQPSSFQTDDPNIDVAVTTMTDFYVWIRTHGSAWNPNYTRVVRVYPDSPSINSVVMNMIVAVGSGGTTISSGGGVNYYLNGGTSQGILDGSTYYEMNKVPVEGNGVDFFKINTTGFQNIAQFVTDAGDPGLLNIPAGNWPLGFYMSASDNSGAPKFYAEIYKYSAAGVFTLLGSSVATPEVISNGQAIDYYTSTVAIPDTTLLVTDRIAIRIFVNTDGNRTINLHTQDSHLSTVGTTFTRGLTAINGLIKQVQFLAIGNAGSDAAIVSSDDTHTINLPTASATKRGLLNSTDWSTFNAKQPSLSGDGFVKISGSTISYDNSSYQPLDGDLTAIGALAGTSGILKKTGANTWELDTSVYLSTATAASTYQRLDKMVSNLLPSDTEYPNSNAVLAKLALKADAANPSFTGSMNISGAESRVNFYDENAARKYFIGYDGGFLRIYQDAGSTSRFYINSSGKTFIPGTLEVGSIIKTNGLATEFLKADGTVDSNTYALNSALANYLLSATAGTTYQTLANLSTDLTASTTKYPSVTAVNNGLATKQPLDADLTAIAALTGTSGLLKKTAADTWTLDTAAYITSSALTNYLLSADAATTYQRKDKMVSNLLASDTEYPNSNAVIAALALKANAANPTFIGDFTISGTTPRLYFVDTDNNPDYTLFTDSGYFYIYDQTAGATKFQITPSGNAINTGTLTSTSFIKSGGTSSQFLKADGTVDSTAYAPNSSLSNYLPLSGGTLTGNLTYSPGDATDWYIKGPANGPTIRMRYSGGTTNRHAALGWMSNTPTYSDILYWNDSVVTSNVLFSGTSASFSGNLTVSSGNTTGGGIILADDGDIVDLNDAYCSMRFSYGVRIFSGNRSGTPVITLRNTGDIIATGNISGSNFSGSSSGTNTGDQTNISGNAATASSAALLTPINTTSTAASAWNPQSLTYRAWGQAFTNTAISADSGDFVWYLRPSQYSAGGTELSLMIDGDYYAGSGQYKVLHAGNYSSYSLPLTGGNLSGNLLFSDSGTTKRGIQGTVGTNDFWFVGGGATASNSGYLEISTGDDAQQAGQSEPIYVRQYGPGDPLTGTLVRTAALLDGNGNTSFPGTIQGANYIWATKVGGTNSTPGFQVRGSGGGPRIQTYGLDADSNAWMGIGTDMAGNPYEHSLYFPYGAGSYANMGRQTIGSYDGTTYSPKATFLANGRIGFGIVSPEAALHVAQSGQDDQLILGSSANNRDHAMFMYSGPNKAEVMRYQSGSRFMLGGSGNISKTSIFGGGSERLTVESGGVTAYRIFSTSGGGYNLVGGSALVLGGSGATFDNSTGVRLTESYGPLWNCADGATWHHQIINGSSLIGFQAAGGNYGSGRLYATGDITAYYSDRRLKHNLNRIDNAIEKVMSLTGYTYQHNELGQTLLSENPHKFHSGLIAQEVQSVLPEVVTIAPFDLDGYDEYGNGISRSGNNYLTIKYERIVPLLIESTKEQQSQINEQRELILSQSNEIAKLKNIVNSLLNK